MHIINATGGQITRRALKSSLFLFLSYFIFFFFFTPSPSLSAMGWRELVGRVDPQRARGVCIARNGTTSACGMAPVIFLGPTIIIHAVSGIMNAPLFAWPIRLASTSNLESSVHWWSGPLSAQALAVPVPARYARLTLPTLLLRLCQYCDWVLQDAAPQSTHASCCRACKTRSSARYSHAQAPSSMGPQQHSQRPTLLKAGLSRYYYSSIKKRLCCIKSVSQNITYFFFPEYPYSSSLISIFLQLL